MENGEITQAAASPAAVETSEVELSSLTDTERHEWLKTGDLPTRGAKTQAESSTASSEVEKTESASASEAGKDQKPRRDNAESRIKELLAEKKRLEDELRDARQPKETKTAESSTAKPEQRTEQPQTLEPPKRPKLEDFKTIEEYEAAMDEYHDKKSDYKIQQALQKDRADREMQKAQAEFNKYLDEAQKRYPNLKEVLPAFTRELAEAHPYVQQFLNVAVDNLADVLMVICQSDESKAEFMREAKADPARAIKRISIVEAEVKAELAKGKGAVEVKETPVRGDDGKFQKASETKVTKAPPPAPEVSGKPNAPGDEAEEALKGDNVRAYMDAENAKALRNRSRY